MARRYPRRHFKRPYRGRRSYASKPETTLGMAKRYGVIAVASGLGIAFGATAWDNAQKRQAILDALPAGYQFSNCDEVRAAGVAPLYAQEKGFADKLDGDGDGVGCEPYRGN